LVEWIDPKGQDTVARYYPVAHLGYNKIWIRIMHLVSILKTILNNFITITYNFFAGIPSNIFLIFNICMDDGAKYL